MTSLRACGSFSLTPMDTHTANQSLIPADIRVRDVRTQEEGAITIMRNHNRFHASIYRGYTPGFAFKKDTNCMNRELRCSDSQIITIIIIIVFIRASEEINEI